MCLSWPHATLHSWHFLGFSRLGFSLLNSMGLYGEALTPATNCQTLNQTLTADFVGQTLAEKIEECRNNVKRTPYSVLAGRKDI